jgi:FkbM family methyltransferase
VNAWAARLRAAFIRRVRRADRIRFTDRHGVRYVLRATDDLSLYFRHRGWPERGEQAFCARHLRPGMVAFDVGAYLGVYALHMARLVGPAGRVHAFEPSPDSHARLVEHVRLNGAGNVITNRCAVHASRAGMTMRLYEPPFESLGTLAGSDVVRGGRVLTPVAAVPVETVTLDDYCARAAITRIDLLKLDAEGTELPALEGAGRLLANEAIRCVLVEVGVGFHAVADLLERHGFRLWSVTPDGGLRPLGAVPERGPNVVALHGPPDPS